MIHHQRRLGAANGRAKLTEPQVRAIRARHVWNCPINGAKAIARELGMGKESIRLIVIGENWPHVDTPAQILNSRGRV